MPGPIVRSGPSKKFSEQWDSVFGTKTKKQAAPSTKKAAKKKATKKAAKKKSAKKKS